jgi:hypothetical protein
MLRPQQKEEDDALGHQDAPRPACESRIIFSTKSVSLTGVFLNGTLFACGG